MGIPQKECFTDISFKIKILMSQTNLLSAELIVLPKSQTIFPVLESKILKGVPKSPFYFSEERSLFHSGPQNPDGKFVLTQFFSSNLRFSSLSYNREFLKSMV